ncbi:RimJ/RimL family protein N-acetyltransferase [Ureibacillus xyleni]|uniref:RimJ/RimL family protein N-acetyltransferase n=1 Tax=Ureibacillus xyleni TaxID=614648 RepID=A0A285SNS7_9BACL|nr:GNAT family N-acetyltransferase [Ureibacillus xyleni]SOC09460.1 RimJ/RimL family protein N-acetyltransferase [Ureibacillus xyleni]
MMGNNAEYYVENLRYVIRSAMEKDAKRLSEVRLQIDGETENLDRERGEAYIDEQGFIQLIKEDIEHIHNLFLVAEVDGMVVGFSRCEGNKLKRTSHKVEFGVCVLKDFWGYGIGQNLLKESIKWADLNDIKKIYLNVLETNVKAIKLYEKYGFEVEGVIKKDKLLSDGNYYNTVIMGRFNLHEGEL